MRSQSKYESGLSNSYYARRKGGAASVPGSYVGYYVIREMNFSGRRMGAQMSESSVGAEVDWSQNGVRIIRNGELDTNTPQTPGMTRAEAISHARGGAQKLWAGTVVVHPNARTGPHHHGELETVIYIVRGRARFRWGNQLEFVEEAGPGDFVYVPPFVPHQELNARKDIPVEAVIVRSGQEPIVVNLDIPSPEAPSEGPEGDPFHQAHQGPKL
jgi:uncharacterized RmlC-like cupin family protein